MKIKFSGELEIGDDDMINLAWRLMGPISDGGGATAPVAAFSADVTSGFAPLTVTFTDESTNSPTSWEWDFGDGSAHSADQNPTHTYTVQGTYTVVLIATNAGGSDTETKTDYITVGPTTLFYDTFTDANGTALAAHTPDTDLAGNGWTSQSGTPIITSNLAVNNNGSVLGIPTHNPGQADVTITVTANMQLASGTQFVGVIFRFVNINNYWVANLVEPNVFRIQKIEGGVSSTPATMEIPAIVSEQDYEIQVAVSGDSITACLNGGDKLTLTDSFNQAATIYGLRLGFASFSRADNFKIETYYEI